MALSKQRVKHTAVHCTIQLLLHIGKDPLDFLVLPIIHKVFRFDCIMQLTAVVTQLLDRCLAVIAALLNLRHAGLVLVPVTGNDNPAGVTLADTQIGCQDVVLI